MQHLKGNWLVDVNGIPSAEFREKPDAELYVRLVTLSSIDKSAQMIDKERVERLNQPPKCPKCGGKLPKGGENGKDSNSKENKET